MLRRANRTRLHVKFEPETAARVALLRDLARDALDFGALDQRIAHRHVVVEPVEHDALRVRLERLLAGDAHLGTADQQVCEQHLARDAHMVGVVTEVEVALPRVGRAAIVSSLAAVSYTHLTLPT